MYVPIENMPDHSRVWIYQSSRKLNDPEVKIIEQALTQFCSQWATHGSPLQTSFSIDNQRFVLLAINEQSGSASGCSIDSSTHIIKALEQNLNVDFFNRTEVAFLENEDITTYPLTELKNLFGIGKLNENSVTFNTLVPTLGDWRHNGQIQVKNSWLKRYITKVPVS